jgi:hypothetical protein
MIRELAYKLPHVCSPVRAGLDYGEEVHQSRILGEWSNTISYIMGSSPNGLYDMVKTLMDKCQGLIGIMTRLQHILLGEYSGSHNLGQPQTLGQETWPPKNSNLRHYDKTKTNCVFPSCLTYRPLP